MPLPDSDWGHDWDLSPPGTVSSFLVVRLVHANWTLRIDEAVPAVDRVVPWDKINNNALPVRSSLSCEVSPDAMRTANEIPLHPLRFARPVSPVLAARPSIHGRGGGCLPTDHLAQDPSPRTLQPLRGSHGPINIAIARRRQVHRCAFQQHLQYPCRHHNVSGGGYRDQRCPRPSVAPTIYHAKKGASWALLIGYRLRPQRWRLALGSIVVNNFRHRQRLQEPDGKIQEFG
ncbi:uncharacterized protein ATNIH1004_001981 [Aspergillus tanneri]|uniref:Uncharacterized protein n=1 Tax=Aspergillus tanneri TaxID=1220188 RepID=A0A5M9MA08_9EURO|nr:uncharacterized protein ATNIH1004_001981 [Aspergillus tanneri]KAA8641379.1 hypothetical protein ATNIH1004_001981 [Aspergillus tanneri]